MSEKDKSVLGTLEEEESRQKMLAELHNKFITAVENNSLKHLGQLLEDANFKPDKQTMTRAIQHAMESGNDTIAVFLLNYCTKFKHKNLEIEFDFKVNNESPLLYAVSKNNVHLVEALFDSGTVPIPKETELRVIDSPYDEDTPNLMTKALKNLKETDNSSRIILSLLLQNGVDFSNVTANLLKFSLMELSPLKDPAEGPIMDFIFEQLKKKHPHKLESLCVSILTDYNFALDRPTLLTKALSFTNTQIIERTQHMIENFLLTSFSDEELAKIGGYAIILTSRGFTFDFDKLMKQREEGLEAVFGGSEGSAFGSKSYDDRTLETLLATPSLTEQDYKIPVKFLTTKLERLFIPQRDRDQAANYFLSTNDDKLYLLVAAGARPTLSSKQMQKLEIGDIKRIDLEFFKHAANIGDINKLKLMLDGGMRFRDIIALDMLQGIIMTAKATNPALEELLTPVLLKEQKIFNANAKSLATDRKDDIAYQFKLRPKMLAAIGTGNVDAIIDLVAKGADPNFGGDGMQDEYVVKGAIGYNARGINPLQFACMHPIQEKAIAIFKVLQDLGASIKIANLYTQKSSSKDLPALYQRSENRFLYNTLKKAAVRESDESSKEKLTAAKDVLKSFRESAADEPDPDASKRSYPQ